MQPKLAHDVLQTAIDYLRMVGELSSYKLGPVIKVYRLLNCCVYVLNIVLLLANLPNAKGYMYIKIVESLGTITHGFVKYICLFYYNTEILDLVSDARQFWDIREIEATFPMAKSLLVLCKRSQKLFMLIAVVAIEQYFFRPMTADNGLIFPSRIITDSIGFKAALLFSQYYIMLSIAVVVPGFDIFYTSYSAYVIIQLRMLKYRFEHITQNICLKDINRYIKHHQFMLSIFHRIYGVYYWMFFFIYFIILFTACVQLYVLLLGYRKIIDLLVALVSIGGLLLDFGVYTFPVEEIIFQFSNISSAIYKSLWYERSLRDRKLLLFVMMKAQSQDYVSAGGIIEININTFASIIRRIFSFYTILRNVL